MKYTAILAVTALVVMGTSCRKDFDFKPSTGNLEFSKDTVFLDTVFANIGSSTYSLKVYNNSNDDIKIPSIGLRNGLESNYRLNVDGAAGKEFENVPLLAKDSLFIFIEITTPLEDVNENEFLYTDAIEFASSNTAQQVELVTLIKDAIFLYPRTLSNGTTETLLLGLDEEGNEIRIEGFFLEDDELDFSNEKPYVIYGYAAVPNERTANFQAGARVHFHKGSGILVSPDGSIQINGALSMDQEVLENEVIFEGDRLEPEFANIPGQWGTIWFARGSTNNQINYLTIKNATIGLFVEGDGDFDNPNLQIGNSQIYNSLNSNLRTRTAKIDAENLVLGGAGFASAVLGLGGDYSFNHTTIANYWQNGFRNTPSLIITNSEENSQNQVITSDLVNASFSNTIIDGNRRIELGLLKNDDAMFQYNFDTCTIKFNDTGNEFNGNPLYDFDNTVFFESIFLNGETAFQNTPENDFSLLPNSIAVDNGNIQFSQFSPLDILGVNRENLPDIGAYEYSTEN
ncbi:MULTISPECIES: choice-of-anchor Q domain-containing protein [unclassified Croceitalea]|uniref:choice-of-anchor Q domain-containing protein n=1 Tax=unclassified Croceitalea TaxID=2632280 RepID=UPI0030D953EA